MLAGMWDDFKAKVGRSADVSWWHEPGSAEQWGASLSFGAAFPLTLALPQGEGIPCAALGGIETLRIREQRRTFLPLPGGRGPGCGPRLVEDQRLLTGH